MVKVPVLNASRRSVCSSCHFILSSAIPMLYICFGGQHNKDAMFVRSEGVFINLSKTWGPFTT